MCVKCNAIECSGEFAQASKAVLNCFYVDNGLTGAVSIEEAVKLQRKPQCFFPRVGFFFFTSGTAVKWKYMYCITFFVGPCMTCRTFVPHKRSSTAYTLQRHLALSEDQFCLSVQTSTHVYIFTMRKLVSEVTKTFNMLGWFSPALLLMKILLQRLWEQKVIWDDPVPSEIHKIWKQWRSELLFLADKRILWCYHSKHVQVAATELHGFSDASELAYAGMIYLHVIDTTSEIHVALVTFKTQLLLSRDWQSLN